jgi:hypothetical protein
MQPSQRRTPFGGIGRQVWHSYVANCVWRVKEGWRRAGDGDDEKGCHGMGRKGGECIGLCGGDSWLVLPSIPIVSKV